MMPLCIFCNLDIIQSPNKKLFCRIVHPECGQIIRRLKKTETKKACILSIMTNYREFPIEQIQLILRNC